MIPLILAAASILFFLCSGYQLFYLAVPHFVKPRGMPEPMSDIRCAVLICARNEEAVIAGLIESVKRQTYHADVFVLADNCTDSTADTARRAGAVVWERFNTARVGKGYALSALLSHMEREGYIFERYFIFDADNLLERDCIYELCRVFDAGYPIVTGCRASKNFGENAVSAGYGLFFLRESHYLNLPRMLLGTSCAVSGTGFGFTREILTSQTRDGDMWPFHLLTEDLEFTAYHVINGQCVGYADKAVFYDEQPTSFIQSWHQRLRWSKGGLQVAARYGRQLFSGALHGRFSCFDILNSSFPAALYNLICTVCLAVMLFWGCVNCDLSYPLFCLGRTVGTMCMTFFLMGAMTMLAERRRIPIPPGKRILYTLTFPLFMLTYIPISLASFVAKVEWKPIIHKPIGVSHVQHTDL